MPQLPKDYPDYKPAGAPRHVLDELAVCLGMYLCEDSLLRLAAMTPEQRMEIINKIIDEPKRKKKREAAEREEYLANQAAQV